MTEARARVED